MKRAYIIHGWDGYPTEGWFPWAKSELEKIGYHVQIPMMPHPSNPTIADWVDKLLEIAPLPDDQTIFIGHSIGCQTILRYLEQLPSSITIQQAVFVAGWFTLMNIHDEESQMVAAPWLTTPIDFSKVLSHTNNFTTILSTDDPVVPFEENKRLFTECLHAEVLATSGGHLGGVENIREVPELLEAISIGD